MKNNKKLNLKEFEELNIKKYKIYIISVICFLIGFIVAPNGINKTEYLKVVEKADKIESELTNSKESIEDLQNQIKQAKIFLDLDEDSRDTITSSINDMKNKKEEEVKAKELEKQKAEEEAKAKKEANVTDLFKEVYQAFAPNVGSSLYEGIKQSIGTSGYKYDLTEPTLDVSGEIKVYDKSSSDNLTLSFYPDENTGIEVLSLVQYNRGTNAIASSDDLHINPKSYSIYDGENKDVYSIDEQKKFIFE